MYLDKLRICKILKSLSLLCLILGFVMNMHTSHVVDTTLSPRVYTVRAVRAGASCQSQTLYSLSPLLSFDSSTLSLITSLLAISKPSTMNGVSAYLVDATDPLPRTKRSRPSRARQPLQAIPEEEEDAVRTVSLLQVLYR